MGFFCLFSLFFNRLFHRKSFKLKDLFFVLSRYRFSFLHERKTALHIFVSFSKWPPKDGVWKTKICPCRQRSISIFLTARVYIEPPLLDWHHWLGYSCCFCCFPLSLSAAFVRLYAVEKTWIITKTRDFYIEHLSVFVFFLRSLSFSWRVFSQLIDTAVHVDRHILVDLWAGCRCCCCCPLFFYFECCFSLFLRRQRNGTKVNISTLFGLLSFKRQYPLWHINK